MMLGPTIGGLLINIGDWPLIFFINVPIGIIGILMMSYFVPASVVNVRKQKFDITGTIVLTFMLTCFTLGITLLEEQNYNLNIVLILLLLSIYFFGNFSLSGNSDFQPYFRLENV